MKANISVIIIANYVLRNTLMDSDVQLREMTEESVGLLILYKIRGGRLITWYEVKGMTMEAEVWVLKCD